MAFIHGIHGTPPVRIRADFIGEGAERADRFFQFAELEPIANLRQTQLVAGHGGARLVVFQRRQRVEGLLIFVDRFFPMPRSLQLLGRVAMRFATVG